MSIGSTYFIASCVILFGVFTLLIIRKFFEPNAKIASYSEFLYSFFSFGFIFAGCISLQGALLNPTQIIELNGLFYILGITFLMIAVVDIVYHCYNEFNKNFWKIRVFMKAFILALCHWSPLYLLIVVIIVDLLLMYCEYQLSAYSKFFQQPWITVTLLVNISLLLVVFVPIFLLSLFVITLLLVIVIILEAYIHYRETQRPIRLIDLEVKKNDHLENDDFK